jgi:hypothetical protein
MTRLELLSYNTIYDTPTSVVYGVNFHVDHIRIVSSKFTKNLTYSDPISKVQKQFYRTNKPFL